MAKDRLSLFCTLLLAGAAFLLGGGRAFGYAGEQGSVDGSNLTVSTHHLHLTRALAYCAGFDARTDVRNPVSKLLSQEEAKDAEVIAFYDEMTDQGTLGTPGSGPFWTNITPTADWNYTLPDPASLGCSGLEMVFPIPQGSQPPRLPEESFWDPAAGWFTNRFGPWATQFHFPLKDSYADDLAVLRTFATTAGTKLVARSVYAYGPTGSNLWSGSVLCTPSPQPKELVTTNVPAGSLAALGTFLHSLGDSYSHGVCFDHWPADHKPVWYYHTPLTTRYHAPETSLIDGCAFNAHSLEFGCPNSEWRAKFATNVVDGGLAVFNELLQAAKDRGHTPRLAAANAHQDWLKRQLQRYAILFETNLSPKGGACRVSFAYALMAACGGAADTSEGTCLEDVNVAKGGTCEEAGKTSCENGTLDFPLTPVCTPAKAAAASR